MEERKKESNQDKVRKLTREIRKACRNAKTKELVDKCNEINKLEELNDNRAMYQRVKQLVPRKRPTIGSGIEDKDGEIIMGKEKTLIRWKEYMEELYDSQRPQLETETEAEEVTTIEETIEETTEEEEVEEKEEDITEEEIMKAIKSLKKNKTTGADNISIEMIRAAGPGVMKDICKIIQNIYKGSANIPDDWMITNFIALPKIKKTTKCENHRTIALIPHVMKIISKTIYNRIHGNLNERLDTMQYGFRPKVGTVESIAALKTILMNRIHTKQETYLCFIDFVKAFDRVEHDLLVNTLRKRNVNKRDIELIEDIYSRQQAFMQMDEDRVNPINIKRGVRQGCILSPLLFNTYADEMMNNIGEKFGVEALEDPDQTIDKITYADDTVLIAESEEDLKKMLNNIESEGKKWSIQINEKKTKTMVVKGKGHVPIKIKSNCGNKNIEQVKNFCYLGIQIGENMQHDIDVRCNIGKAKENFWRCKELFRNNITLDLKRKLLHSMVFAILRYGAECFSLTKSMSKKITSFEYWCYRRILKISWVEMETNRSVLQRMGLKEEVLLKSILKRKWTFFGHVARGSAGHVLKRLVERSWRKIGRGRRRTTWLEFGYDDVGEKKTDIRMLLKKAENKDEWRARRREKLGI